MTASRHATPLRWVIAIVLAIPLLVLGGAAIPTALDIVAGVCGEGCRADPTAVPMLWRWAQAVLALGTFAAGPVLGALVLAMRLQAALLVAMAGALMFIGWLAIMLDMFAG